VFLSFWEQEEDWKEDNLQVRGLQIEE